MKYTEEELKLWFEKMMKKYPNCAMTDHLKMVKILMFDDFIESNRLENFLKEMSKST